MGEQCNVRGSLVGERCVPVVYFASHQANYVIGPLRRFALGLIGVAFVSQALAGATIGVPVVLSADTVLVNGEELRLAGVDAPALDQICPAGDFTWRCGLLGRLRLNEHIAGKAIRCEVRDPDAQGQVLATCWLGVAADISEWVVAQGWGLASRSAPERLRALESRARRDAQGLWANGFEPSHEWRTACALSHQEVDAGCNACALRRQELARRLERKRSVDQP